MNDLDRILEGLVRRTANGKLQWKRTVSDNEFVTAVDAIGIMVRELGRNNLGFPIRRQLEIHDERDATIAVIETDGALAKGSNERYATDEQTSQLNKLYVLARRSALDPDATLAKLAQLLETD